MIGVNEYMAICMSTERFYSLVESCVSKTVEQLFFDAG